MNPFVLRYPGRFLVIGKDPSAGSGQAAYVAIYGATGRSPSSLARRFVRENDGVYMTAVDGTVSKEKNPELFEYPAVRFFRNGIVVANGRHIDDIVELQSRDARQQISYALAEEAYEPDENHTPRITGCLIESNGKMDAAVHIVRYAADGIDRSSWSVPLEAGKGSFISTYAGEDARPAPSFPGRPVPVDLAFGSARDAAKAIFDSFAPPSGAQDYRVGVVALYGKLGGQPEIAIVNRIA